jgi:hypothetical protein
MKIKPANHQCAFICLLCCAALPTLAFAADPAPATAPANQPATDQAAASLRIAVLDLDVSNVPKQTKELGDLVSGVLSAEAGLQTIERPSIQKVFEEQELALSGLSDQSTLKVGKIVGANVIVTGRLIGKDKPRLALKAIGTETTLSKVVLVPVGQAGLEEAVVAAASEMGRYLSAKGVGLLGKPEPVDPAPAYKQRLAAVKNKPRIAVVIAETHYAGPPRPIVDPAVETEIKKMLRETGFELVDVPQNDLADVLRDKDKEGKPAASKAWPQSLDQAQYVIVGKSFSEFNGRFGNLVGCSGRAEINVINRADGSIFLADRANTKAVDLGENTAAKKSLQEAGRELGTRVLGAFADSLAPQAKP